MVPEEIVLNLQALKPESLNARQDKKMDGPCASRPSPFPWWHLVRKEESHIQSAGENARGTLLPPQWRGAPEEATGVGRSTCKETKGCARPRVIGEMSEARVRAVNAPGCLRCDCAFS